MFLHITNYSARKGFMIVRMNVIISGWPAFDLLQNTFIHRHHYALNCCQKFGTGLAITNVRMEFRPLNKFVKKINMSKSRMFPVPRPCSDPEPQRGLSNVDSIIENKCADMKVYYAVCGIELLQLPRVPNLIICLNVM